MRQNQWKRIWKGMQRAKRGQPSVQDGLGCATAHGDGQSPCSNSRSHCTGRFHRTGQCDVQELEKGHGDGQNPKLALIPRSHGLSVKSECRKLLPEPNKSASGITMWRGFNVDTRRRFRKFCRKKAPTLARDPRRWNQAWRGSRAHQVSGKCQTPVPLWTELSSTRRRSSIVYPMM